MTDLTCSTCVHYREPECMRPDKGRVGPVSLDKGSGLTGWLNVMGVDGGEIRIYASPDFGPCAGWEPKHDDATATLLDRYRIALADAIRRPLGVIPDSAAGLVTDAELAEAETRRPRGIEG